jgi:ubiquitin carboxyl-terminal hydrolase 6/32
MSNIYFGLKPDTPEEEREIVEELQEAAGSMQEGDVYYVITAKWWKAWCEQVGVASGGAEAEAEERESGSSSANVTTASTGGLARRRGRGGPGSRLGQIDNTPLLTKKSQKPIQLRKGVKLTRFPQLRPNMRLNDHFTVLPARVWSVLYNWYGGAPVLPRRVISAGDGEHSVLQVELHPYVVEIELRRSKEQRTRPLEFTFSRKTTVAAVRTEVCRKWHLDPERVQLWNFYERNRPVLLTEQEQSLEDAGIVHEQRLVAETQSKDGTWPLDSLPAVADDTPVTPGLVGLNNLGNTCFMNSALQCLSNTPPLADYFISGTYLHEINKDNPLGYHGEVAHTFGEVLQQLWVGDPKKGRLYPSYPPRQFKRIFSKHKPDFEGFEQHDASELLAELIDALHEDVNRVIEKPSVPAVESEGRPDADVAVESWEAHLRRNQVCVGVCVFFLYVSYSSVGV